MNCKVAGALGKIVTPVRVLYVVLNFEMYTNSMNILFFTFLLFNGHNNKYLVFYCQKEQVTAFSNKRILKGELKFRGENPNPGTVMRLSQHPARKLRLLRALLQPENNHFGILQHDLRRKSMSTVSTRKIDVAKLKCSSSLSLA